MTLSTSPLKRAPAARAVLAGSAAIVTGTGPSSIATAWAFASAGASVALASTDDLSIARAARGIEAAGGRAVALPTDLTDTAAVRRLVSAATEAFGGVDLAVNIPGALERGRAVSAADCRAVYVAMECELPAIVEAGGGAIVNAATASAGRRAEDGQCVIGLSRAAALDQMDSAVRVNVVIGGAGSPADFAGAAVWLCSDRAAHVTGAAVPAGLRSADPARSHEPVLVGEDH
jgi:NAD(P)-dependent dehydrogenase (short-subunit alcohol dehydrogenase family)